MKRIEWKVCAWEKCGKKFLPTHGNQKYCSDECFLAQKRGRDREYYKRRNERIKLIDNKTDQLKALDLAPFSTALESYTEDVKRAEFGKFLRQELAPPFYEVNNRLLLLEIEIQELKQALPFIPILSKKHPWREWAIRKTMQIIEAYADTSLADYRNKHLLRKRIEEALGVTQNTAIEIMMKAEERLQRMRRDRRQTDRGDFT